MRIAFALSVALNLVLAGLLIVFNVRGEEAKDDDAKRRSEATAPTLDLPADYATPSDWKRCDSETLNLSVSIPPDWTASDTITNDAFIVQNPAIQEERVLASELLTTETPHGVIMTFEKLAKDGRTIDQFAAPSSDSTVTRKRKIKIGNDSGVLVDSYSIFQQGPYVFYSLSAWIEQEEAMIHVLVSFRDQKVFQDLYEKDVLTIIGSIGRL